MRNLFIIFEGSDGVGKTTVSRQICTLFAREGHSSVRIPLPFSHAVKEIATSKDYNISPLDRQKMMFSDFITTMCEWHRSDYNVFVFDRFTPISSLVYSGDPKSVEEDIKSMMRIVDELYDPLYVVYLISNPPFRVMDSRDYFESSGIASYFLYKEMIDRFVDICREIGTHHKVITTEVDLREVELEQIFEDAVKFMRVVRVASGGLNIE